MFVEPRFGVLDDVQDEPGLPPTTKLLAEPHAMLVYGKRPRRQRGARAKGRLAAP